MADEQQQRRGSLSVELRRVTWTLASTLKDNSTNNAAAPDAMQQRLPLWVALQLVDTNDQLLERFWFPLNDDNTLTQSVTIGSDSSTLDDSDTHDFDLEYQQSSRPLPLTRETLETLANARLQLAVYRGTTRMRTSDELLAELQLPLVDAVLRGRFEQRVSVAAPQFARLDLRVCAHADVDLADYAAGCRVLSFHSFAVRSLPLEWTLPSESDDDALQLCASSDRNLAAYELELRLPVLTSASDGIEATAPPTESIVITGGRLQYEPSRDAVHATADDDSSTDAATEAAVSQLSGTWSVAFPPSSGCTKLYLKDAVAQLREYLYVDKHVGVTLRRTVVENAAKVPDVTIATMRLHLSDLVAPGVTRTLACVALKHVAPVARETLEQELAATTTGDEKKKLQAALAEYDAMLQAAAAISQSLTNAATQLEVALEIASTPLVLLPPAVVEDLSLDVSIEALIAPRDVANEREQQRDALGDLRMEIRRVVLQLLQEYDDAFPSATTATKTAATAATDVVSAIANRDEKRQSLVFRLNTQGAYQNFKEALKKRIVPVIQDRFARAEFALDDDDEGAAVDGSTPLSHMTRDKIAPPSLTRPSRTTARRDEYFGQLYTLVMQHVHAVLHEVVYSDTDALAATHAAALGRPSDHEITATLDALQLKAIENFVNGDVDKSEAMHLDRIAFAETHGAAVGESLTTAASASVLPQTTTMQYPSRHALESVWLDYARFNLAQSDLETAGASLRQSLALNAHALPALLVHTALLCELRDAVNAELFAKAAVRDALAAHGATPASASLSDTSSEERAARDLVLAHALLALYYVEHSTRVDATGNLAQLELLRARQVLQHSNSNSNADSATPTACVASVWLTLAEFAHELRLRGVARAALAHADAFRAPRDVLTARERVLQRVIAAELTLSIGDDADAAITQLQDATEVDANEPRAWLALGRAYLATDTSATTQAIESLERALAMRAQLRSDELRLALALHLGLVLLQASQFGAAERVFLVACDAFCVASCWLGVGIARLRLEQWQAAHVALAEANRLDGTNADVWGYLALLALTSTPRVSQQDERGAKRCVAQALRYNLSNAVLLRELSNAFVAIDRLEDAERLLRRSLVCHDSSLARKLLADVLAAQNCAEDALQQYQQALDDDTDVSSGSVERCALLETCAKLLTTLGRPEDASTYRAMAAQFAVEARSNSNDMDDEQQQERMTDR